MKYALVDGKKTHIRDVERGTIGHDCWHPENEVKACKGSFYQYWRYTSPVPTLPMGYENETEWHIGWKHAIKDEYCEVVLGDNREHRADIKTPNYVIELQYSPIALEEVIDRTDFYHAATGSRVLWVANVYNAWEGNLIKTTLDPSDKKKFFVTWKRPKKWITTICERTNTNVFLDFRASANNLILLWSHNGQLYGKWVSKSSFYTTYLADAGTSKDAFLEAIQNIK